jgi:hypothetical protein
MSSLSVEEEERQVVQLLLVFLRSLTVEILWKEKKWMSHPLPKQSHSLVEEPLSHVQEEKLLVRISPLMYLS